MRHSYKIILMLFLVVGLPSSSFAQKVVNIKYLGVEVAYPLPRGFCDITEELLGIMLKGFLDKIDDPTIPKAQIIISTCDSGKRQGAYPWGWIGLQKDQPMPQSTYNKFVEGLLNDEKIYGSLTKKMDELSSEAFADTFGMAVDANMGKQKVVWADDDGITLIMNGESVVDGVLVKEVILSSSSVVGGTYFHTYIYNAIDGDISGKDIAVELINNSGNIHKLN